MGYARWRHQQVAGGHPQFLAVEQEQSVTFEHVIDLVLPGMRVQRVLLARLERVEAHQQARRLEQRDRAHLGGGIDRVIGGPDDGWMGHGHGLVALMFRRQ